MNHAEKSAFLT